MGGDNELDSYLCILLECGELGGCKQVGSKFLVLIIMECFCTLDCILK